jgi:hypothetical protein
MENFDIPATADRGFVYVSFSEKVPVRDYLRTYLDTRRLPVSEGTLVELQDWVKRIPGQGPLYKADVDYFFDANVFRGAMAGMKKRKSA